MWKQTALEKAVYLATNYPNYTAAIDAAKTHQDMHTEDSKFYWYWKEVIDILRTQEEHEHANQEVTR